MPHLAQLYASIHDSEVIETNFSSLAALKRPAKRIPASHKGLNATKATEQEADNLCADIFPCIGVRVMLNGDGPRKWFVGFFHDIWWDTSQEPSSLPSVVLVHFDNYSRPQVPIVFNDLFLFFLPLASFSLMVRPVLLHNFLHT